MSLIVSEAHLLINHSHNLINETIVATAVTNYYSFTTKEDQI